MSKPLSNRLLSCLSLTARKSLEQKLKAVSLPIRTPIFEPGKLPQYAYFLTSGIASVVTDMENGNPVEVGLLGCESVTGTTFLLSGQQVSTRCFMQVAGTGLRIDYKELALEFSASTEFHARILQQVQYELLTLSQLSACNRLHEVQERLARWLLMVADRIENDVLAVTQEFLGQMLGTRRSTVTTTAGILQQAGMIEIHRGRVTILNRQRLQDAACPCYNIMRGFREHLYPEPAQPA
jgi:CRP-like cAMP-binding protein